MRRDTRRRLVIAIVAAIAAAGLFALAYVDPLGFFGRFEADGITINPRAAIRDDATYELIVWEESFLTPWAARDQAEMLEQAIEEFSQSRPNVKIAYALLDGEAGRAQLASAIAAGRPPDVYGTMRGSLIGSPRLVPASPYMEGVSRSEPPPLLSAAEDALTVDGIIWGWPRGLWWEAWLGNTAMLAQDGIDFTRLAAEGWDRNAFLEWVGNVAGHRTHPVMLDLTDVRILEQLMASAGAPAYVNPSGRIAWVRQQVADAAGFVRALREKGAFGNDVELMSRGRLAALYNDDTSIIGPVNPYVARSAFQRKQDQLLFVPVPHPSAGRYTPTEVSAYFVFHQAVYQGDDHTRLAAELAAFLAVKSEEWLIESVGLLPAHTRGWAVWDERAPWDVASRTVLEHFIEYAVSVPDQRDAPMTAAIREALLPAWRSFLAERMTVEQFTDAAIDAIQRVLDGRSTSPSS